MNPGCDEAVLCLQKSPPLRKGKVGTKSRSTREPVAFPAVSPDPGMIGPFSKAEPSPAAASPDLLDLEALSFSEPAEAVPALQSNGVNLLNDLEPQFAASGVTFCLTELFMAHQFLQG